MRIFLVIPKLPKWFSGELCEKLSKSGFSVSVSPTFPHPTMHIWRKRR